MVRAVVSVVVLAAAMIGAPVGLAMASPLVWASGGDALFHLLSRPDTGAAALVVVLAVAWLAWAQFTLSVLVEIVAQVRGRVIRPRWSLAVSQRAAATLISSIVVLLPTGTALAAPVSAHAISAHPSAGPARGPSSLGDATPAARTAQMDGPMVQAAQTQTQRTYTVREVRPAESLWGIAEKELGNGELWTAIADLNEGRTMPDGAIFHAEGFIQPGWVLRLPDTGQHAGQPHDAKARTVVVKEGQTLSDIARQQLGDASQYPRIFEANRNARFTDPGLIYPGQHLTVPSPTSDGTKSSKSAPPPDTLHRPAPSQGSPGAQRDRDTQALPHQNNHASPRPKQPEQPAGPSSADPTHTAAAAPPAAHPSPTPTPTSEPSTAHPSPTSAGPAAPDARNVSHQSDTGIGTQQLAGIGALLAAALTGGLALKRILQQRRRKAGETIAMPDEASALEQSLAAAAEPGSVQLLDTAARTLHHHLLDQGEKLPALHGARVTGRTVELRPDAPATAPIPPFTAGADGWWTLPEKAQLLDADQARKVPAPWPGLVTIGSNPDGDLLLVNLPHTRTLLIEGNEAEVRTVVRAIAMEAATCSWSDRTEILTVGLGEELSTLLPQGRVRAVPHLRAATRDLGELLLEQHQSVDAETKPLPWLLICAADAEEQDAWDLADAVAAARDLPVALVLPAARTAACFPEAEILRADGDEQTCSALSSRVVIQHVTDQDYAQFIADLRTAEEPARPAEGPWRNVPDPTQIPETDGHIEEGTPFAALAAAAGPATIHRFPMQPPTGEPAEGDAEGVVDEEGRAPAAVVTLHKGTADEHAEQVNPAGTGSENPDAPQIQVLGPVAVTGIQASGHGGKLASLAALLFFKPGRGAEALCEAMDPASPWSRATLQSRMSELRSRLGSDTDGELYLPRHLNAGYRLSPAVRCDWVRFQHLAEQGLALGPDVGLAQLEEALELVRGRPFEGGDHAWAAPLLQEMLARITDVAHTIATWRLTGPSKDLDAARRSITIGLEVDDSAELLYQGWMKIEHAAGNRAGIYKAVEALQTVNRRLDVGMLPASEALIEKLLASPAHAEVM
ncbi:LysM peptidoglycan-binding domain-containing protein [Streptomyces noursei]|nr:LysM peptidoglycan-binding domain-containing protein [Streptomyces noursei]